MERRKIQIRLIIALLVVGAFFCGLPRAGAETVIHEGTITKAPWQNKYFYIEIDSISYMFMPQVQIAADFTKYKLQPMSSSLARYFTVGTHLMFAKQGFRIYRVYFPGQEGTAYEN